MTGRAASILAWIWAVFGSLYGVSWLIDGAWAPGIALLVSGLLSSPRERFAAPLRRQGLATWPRFAVAACCAILGIYLIESRPEAPRSRVCVNTLVPGEDRYVYVDNSCVEEEEEEEDSVATDNRS